MGMKIEIKKANLLFAHSTPQIDLREAEREDAYLRKRKVG